VATLKLGYDERNSAIWVKLKAHIEDRLILLRSRNDAVSLDSEQTALLRGQIKELKILLELGNPDTGVTAED
jgi:hypothetical protein